MINFLERAARANPLANVLLASVAVSALVFDMAVDVVAQQLNKASAQLENQSQI